MIENLDCRFVLFGERNLEGVIFKRPIQDCYNATLNSLDEVAEQLKRNLLQAIQQTHLFFRVLLRLVICVAIVLSYLRLNIFFRSVCGLCHIR